MHSMPPMRSLFVTVLSAVVALAGSVDAQTTPPNASPTLGGGWSCNFGYHRAGDQCEKTKVPPNATATLGGGWQCNLGFRKQGENCAAMTSTEAQQQLFMLRALSQQKKSVVHHIDCYEFSLRDIERRCEAYVWDREFGELECSSGLRIIERKCEVDISDWPDGEIDCKGSELRFVEQACSVEMYSDEYGSLSC